MKRKIESGLKQYYENRFPEEFIQNANNLMFGNECLFDEIDNEKLEAIIYRDKAPYSAGDRAFIYTAPMVLDESDFKSMNPKKAGKITMKKIYTNDRIFMLRKDGIIKSIPSLAERLKGMKTIQEPLIEIAYSRQGQSIDELREGNGKIIPVYSDNEDYKRLMEYIERKS